MSKKRNDNLLILILIFFMSFGVFLGCGYINQTTPTQTKVVDCVDGDYNKILNIEELKCEEEYKEYIFLDVVFPEEYIFLLIMASGFATVFGFIFLCIEVSSRIK